MIERPTESEYASVYRGYVSHVTETDIVAALEAQLTAVRATIDAIPAARESWRYAPDKWTINEVIGHLGDGERVFGFRAYAFARGDAQPLPGFDENTYVARGRATSRSMRSLFSEFAQLRLANLEMLRSLDMEQSRLQGVANGASISVRALAYIMVGHVRHHLGTLAERYGVRASTP